MPLGTFSKDPSDVVDFTLNWAGWLAAGDQINSSSWAVPGGITQTTPAPSYTNTTTTIWLSGGTSGTSYTIANTVTTAGGRTGRRTMVVMAQDL